MPEESPDPPSPPHSGEPPAKKQRRSRKSDPKSRVADHDGESRRLPSDPVDAETTSDTNVNRKSDDQPSLFTAHRTPLPSAYSAMNPGGYPLNNPQFTGHSFPQSTPGGQGSTSPTDSHASVPGHPYAYPNYNYPGHSYPQYPQYPQPIMMYGPPRTQGTAEPVHASPSPVSQQQQQASSSSGKRKSNLLTYDIWINLTSVFSRFCK